MTDIELVIKIPKDSYKATCIGNMLPPDVENVVNAIKNGTPLPKGHGALCSKEDVKANHQRWLGYLDEDMITRLNIAVDRDVKTIVEEDKQE